MNDFVNPQKKVLILRHSEVYGRVNSKTKLHEKISLKNKAPAKRIESMFLSANDKIPSVCFYFVPRNRIPSFPSSERN